MAQEPDPYRANLEVRLIEMQEQIRALTNQTEKNAYQMNRLADRLERALADIEARLSVLEQQAGISPASPSPAAQGATSPGGQMASGMSGEGEQSGTVLSVPPGGQPPPGNEETPAQPSFAAPEPEDAPEQYLEGNDPESRFNNAFVLLRRDELEAAEKSFRAFLTLHSDHPLAANAQYWLGKTYYAREDYDQAARTLLQAFQAHGQSGKGPDILLHLGLSLSAIGQNQDACDAYTELETRYTDLNGSVVRKLEAAQEAAGCS
ncbi:MAG: tol-pal system protein YbgF [Alphaproteobacteria bacterium]|nr:tol-pal system protein YbgF [Alphaproteobacteria bacterium]